MSLVPPQLHHATNTYLIVYLNPELPHPVDPRRISSLHPALTPVESAGMGTGTFRELLVLSVPVQQWADSSVARDVLAALNASPDVVRVELLEKPKMRVKRVHGREL